MKEELPSKQTLDSEIIKQAQRDLEEMKKKQPIVHFEVSLDMAMSVIAFLQFALKHHTLKKHPSHVLTEGFARQVVYRIAKTSALEQVINQGWEEPEGPIH